ncbi:hypothetical protein KIN20_013975 [Parelaphostrongylus tenuis]|uniref:Uncharacterized protein n=1 Tax=Parelaphostrongylus tenuis TaxID=148309 RepID=A0AAD5QNY2_PARTN|nr:hypothetical protein KIN20_013975 [Parelaphostrongylus tenuis]
MTARVKALKSGSGFTYTTKPDHTFGKVLQLVLEKNSQRWPPMCVRDEHGFHVFRDGDATTPLRHQPVITATAIQGSKWELNTCEDNSHDAHSSGHDFAVLKD